MQAHAPRLQFLDNPERVEGRPEQAIELRGDHHVALCQLGEQRAGGGPLGDRDGAADALLDLAPLHVEAFSLGGLLRGRDPAISEGSHFCARQLVSLRQNMTGRDGS